MFNRDELKSITKSSTTAKNIMEFLADRKRFRRQTDLNQMAQHIEQAGMTVVEDDYLKAFQALEKAGVGHLIIGRRGKPNKFKWNYNLKTVGQAATTNEPVEIEELGRKPRTVKPEPQEGSTSPKRGPGRPRKSEGDMITVTLTIPRELLKLIKAA